MRAQPGAPVLAEDSIRHHVVGYKGHVHLGRNKIGGGAWKPEDPHYTHGVGVKEPPKPAHRMCKPENKISDNKPYKGMDYLLQ